MTDIAASVPTSKPRSGYGRLRNRHHHLVEMHERLQADHQKLVREHEALKVRFTTNFKPPSTSCSESTMDLLSDLRKTHQMRAPASSFVRWGSAMSDDFDTGTATEAPP